MPKFKRYAGDGFVEFGSKLPVDLDEKVEAIAYWSRKKKWQVIRDLLTEALRGKKIKPIPPDARKKP